MFKNFLAVLCVLTFLTVGCATGAGVPVTDATDLKPVAPVCDVDHKALPQMFPHTDMAKNIIKYLGENNMPIFGIAEDKYSVTMIWYGTPDNEYGHACVVLNDRLKQYVIISPAEAYLHYLDGIANGDYPRASK